MLRGLVTAAMIIFATSAAAQDPLSKSDANSLAEVIGSSETCSYPLNKDAVTSLVTARVFPAPDDVREEFEYVMSMQSRRLQELSEIEKAAQCALHQKMAEKYGLTL